MTGKGSVDRGNPNKRAIAPVWCKSCNKLRGGSCGCGSDPHKMSCENKCSHKFAEQIVWAGKPGKHYKCCDCGEEFEENV